MSATNPILTLLQSSETASGGWVWAGDGLELPLSETATSAELQTVICIRETFAEVGRYSNGQPAISRNWTIHVVAWPDGSLLNQKYLESAPPGQVEGLAGGVGAPLLDEVFTWAAHPPDGRKIQLWRRELGTMGLTIQHVVASPDGRLLAVGLTDGRIQILETATGRGVHMFRRDEPVSGVGNTAGWGYFGFSADGQALLGRTPTKIMVWDLATGLARQPYTMPFQAADADGRPTSFRFLADGRILAMTTSAAGVMKLWDVITGQELKSVTGPREITPTTSFEATLSSDLHTLAIVEYPETKLTVWDMNTGQMLRELRSSERSHSVRPLFSPDGVTLAAIQDTEVVFWEIATGTIKATIPADGFHFDRVGFSPSGKFLAACDMWADFVLKVWDSALGQEILTTTTQRCLYQFQPDERSLMVAIEGGQLASYNLDTGEKTRLLSAISEDTGLVILSDQRTAFVWNSFGVLQAWDILAGD